MKKVESRSMERTESLEGASLEEQSKKNLLANPGRESEGLADNEVAHQTETISLKGLILSLEKSLL